MTDSNMLKKCDWDEFCKTGLLLFVNQFLHIFGWAIVMEVNDSKIINAYPARTKFRGFQESDVSDAYIKISEYMNKNSSQLLDEAHDGE